ncbi:DsrE family protein [Halomonas sp. PR-M31]|uniref:DsrE family protein n=1 Tax=Halomonas sp. PR-M31 TaxID=1471202 RepID=UPI00069E1A3D|nr:DsrE family protein [Halomonas sp. PR-M31]
MSIFKTLAVLVVSLGVSSGALAADWTTPLIEGYGKIKYDENAKMQPSQDQQYKVVFSVDGDKQTDGVNAELWHVARFMNLMSAADVPPENVHAVAVIHGSATPIAMTDELYQQRNDASNPNLELMKRLTDNGVKIYLCDQAAAGFDIDPDTQVNEYVEPVVSALIAIPQLQLDGYALMP